ncbi:MAG: NTP transferase domain-containing protein [Verrucomicrobia bacterium]|nr:NTP transferase domain-containing protein [Verrucomicrobiota bacterium]
MSKEVVTLILAGGEGVRLRPLTETRCKPAISFGGQYRIIDIAISNAINSGFNEIYVLSQFLAASLNDYLKKTYPSHRDAPLHLEILSPEITPTKEPLYKGTADAVRKNLQAFASHPAEYFIILSGDQIYSMDLKEMLDFAKKTDADVTIATLPVGEEEAKRMGVMKIDSTFQVVDFFEKPATKEILLKYAIAPEIARKHKALHDLSFLGSMGIYIFKRKALLDLLEEDPREDFGKHLIPTQLKKGKTYAYIFSGYWEDIGTITSYYHATLKLTKNPASLNLYKNHPTVHIETDRLPKAHIGNTEIFDSIVCEGSIIAAKAITHSMIGRKTLIEEGTSIKDSIIMGSSPLSPYPPTHIGKNCMIEKAIIDEGAYIGDHVRLLNEKKERSFESKDLVIQDGIIVVKAGARLPSNFSI